MTTDESTPRQAPQLSTFLRGERVIGYYPALVPICGSVTATIMFSQLNYWSTRTKDPDGWIYKTIAQMQEETGLTRTEQETARRKLSERGVVESARRGTHGRMHYRVDYDRLDELWLEHSHSCLQKPCKDECSDAANINAEKQQTLHTEITTETTPETTHTHDAGASARTQRKRTPNDDLWDAFTTALERSPETKSDKGKWAKGVKELLDVGVTPELVPALVDAYQDRFGHDVECNPRALASNLSAVKQHIQKGGSKHEPKGWQGLREWRAKRGPTTQDDETNHDGPDVYETSYRMKGHDDDR